MLIEFTSSIFVSGLPVIIDRGINCSAWREWETGGVVWQVSTLVPLATKKSQGSRPVRKGIRSDLLSPNSSICVCAYSSICMHQGKKETHDRYSRLQLFLTSFMVVSLWIGIATFDSNNKTGSPYGNKKINYLLWKLLKGEACRETASIILDVHYRR